MKKVSERYEFSFSARVLHKVVIFEPTSGTIASRVLYLEVETSLKPTELRSNATCFIIKTIRITLTKYISYELDTDTSEKYQNQNDTKSTSKRNDSPIVSRNAYIY